MFRKECWIKYANGDYGYKNGIRVKREGKAWCVYYGSGDKAYTCGTLKSCKDFLGRHYR